MQAMEVEIKFVGWKSGRERSGDENDIKEVFPKDADGTSTDDVGNDEKSGFDNGDMSGVDPMGGFKSMKFGGGNMWGGRGNEEGGSSSGRCFVDIKGWGMPPDLIS